MNKLSFVLLLIFTTTGILHAQDSRIPWNQDRPLVWEDFRGEADLNVRFNASTNSGIGFSWSYKSDQNGEDFQYEISNFFDSEKSWVKTGSESPHLLKHEQLHFDISELHARQFRKSLSQFETSKNIKADLNRLYRQHEQERLQMQRRFDQETKHSMNKEAQVNWETYIQKQLKKLATYSR